MDDVLNTAPCGFVAFADDGTIVEINQTLTEMLGYTRVELPGWHMDKILPAGGRIFYQTYLFPLLKVQGHVEEIYVALRTKDGRDVPVLLNGVRRERDGRLLNECIAVRMIQRHEYEDQLLEARRLAEESAAAKAKFLSMMSHDLRTPLTAMYGNAQLLAAETLTEVQREAVQAIRDACQMQMTLISDILEFARLESGRVQVEPRPVSAAEVIARAETLVRVHAGDAGLRLTTACDDVVIMADPNRLQQILLNLITNAVKFTPPGGEVKLLCETAGDRAHIRVCDTGIGIAEDDLQRIFTPFVQLDALPSRGVGLGLAISRELARAMGGDVTAESVPGQGSVFTVELPAATVLAV
jgi:PAS domain S-box-containing protein